MPETGKGSCGSNGPRPSANAAATLGMSLPLYRCLLPVKNDLSCVANRLSNVFRNLRRARLETVRIWPCNWASLEEHRLSRDGEAISEPAKFGGRFDRSTPFPRPEEGQAGSLCGNDGNKASTKRARGGDGHTRGIKTADVQMWRTMRMFKLWHTQGAPV